MTQSKTQLEWHFVADDVADDVADAPLQPNPPQGNDLTLGEADPYSQPHRLHESILAVAVLYGVALFLIWQQSAQHITSLETELAAVQDELAQIQREEVAEGESEQATSAPFHHLETAYLRFVASARTADLVEAVGDASDAKYRQLHREFGIPLPVDAVKPTILVDQMVNTDYQFTDDLIISVAHPEHDAKQYGLSEVDALAKEISVRLSQHAFRTLLQGREIPLRWQTMTLALKTHLQLEHGYNSEWWLESTFLMHRYRAQERSLALVQEIHDGAGAQTEPWPQLSMRAYETANPLVEFILETHGYAKVPALLDAFEEHKTWETLSPAVFGVSAAALEEEWHAYLRQKYPRPREWVD